MKNLITLSLIFLAVAAGAQCQNTVSPLSQSVSCAGGGSSVSFTATAFNPTVAVRHDWYSPINPISSGVPIYTSTNSVSFLSSQLAPGVYSVVTTEIVSLCADTVTFTVTSPFAYPTFSVNSPTNYSVGCSPLNQTTLTILNPVSTETPPSTCSYTFLAPSFTGVVTPSVILGGNTATVTTIPGTWTLIVQDNSNFCRTRLMVPVSQNTTAPNISASMLTQTLTCNNPTILATGSSTTPNTVISWMVPSSPPLVSTYSVIMGPPTGPNTSTTSLSYANYTVIATNTLNACASNSMVIINQNFKPPVSSPTIAIGSPTISDCVNPVILNTGASTVTSGGPGATLTNPCWTSIGQPTLCGSNTHSAYAPGLYNLTVQDSYNGCTKSGTLYITGSGGGTMTAAYTHTALNNGVVNFNNTSVGTDSNTTYYWNFGDGYTASGSIVSHTYSSNGAYPVTLVLNNGIPCASNMITQYVNVTGAPCIANPGFSIVPTPTPQYWTITPSYPYNVTQALWSWGDGSFSNSLYSSHSYSAAGTYSICLSVTVSCGNTATSCISQYISKSADNNLIINIDVIPPPLVGIRSQEIESAVYSIYPNPNNGNMNIKIDNINLNSKTVYVEIFDVLGKIVYSTSLETVSGSVDRSFHIDHLTNGSYYVKIKTNSSSHMLKMIINK